MTQGHVVQHDHNRAELLSNRRKLRNRSTSAEASLWKLLSGRKCAGLKFRRQHSVGPYILDFYCPGIKLAIELDGDVHDYSLRREYDQKREAYLKGMGMRVMRLENRQVFERPDLLEEMITRFIQDNTPE